MHYSHQFVVVMFWVQSIKSYGNTIIIILLLGTYITFITTSIFFSQVINIKLSLKSEKMYRNPYQNRSSVIIAHKYIYSSNWKTFLKSVKNKIIHTYKIYKRISCQHFYTYFVHYCTSAATFPRVNKCYWWQYIVRVSRQQHIIIILLWNTFYKEILAMYGTRTNWFVT